MKDLRKCNRSTFRGTYAKAVSSGLLPPDDTDDTRSQGAEAPTQAPDEEPAPQLQVVVQNIDDLIPALLEQKGQPVSETQILPETSAVLGKLTHIEERCSKLIENELAAAPADSGCFSRDDLWTDCIELHRTLLQEYHDLILASQHPNTSSDACQMELQHQLPSWMWSSGIQPLLSLLQKWMCVQDVEQARKARENTSKFITMAYMLVSSLYQTVPVARSTWVLYLGHLSRYRVCLATDDANAQEHWCVIARTWYAQLFESSTPPDEIYRHLATLYCPEPTVQLLHLAQSAMAFKSPLTSRPRLTWTFHGAISASISGGHPCSKVKFLRLHKSLLEASCEAIEHSFHNTVYRPGTMEFRADGFVGSFRQIEELCRSFEQALEVDIQSGGRSSCKSFAYMAIINISACFEYGAESAVLRKSFPRHTTRKGQCGLYPFEGPLSPTSTRFCQSLLQSKQSLNALFDSPYLNPIFNRCLTLMMRTLSIFLSQEVTSQVDAHVHILATFLNALAGTMHTSHLIDDAPWAILVNYLNSKIRLESQRLTSAEMHSFITQPLFPSDQGPSPLPEDHMMRGLSWTLGHFPDPWFSDKSNGLDNEDQNMIEHRNARMLRLGYQLSQFDRWIYYDSVKPEFSLHTSARRLHNSSVDLKEA